MNPDSSTADTVGILNQGPLSKRRQLIAQRLGQIAAEAVPVTLMRDVVAPAGGTHGRLLTSVLSALGEYPELNATFESDVLTTYTVVNLGLAYDGPTGLIVPVVHGAERLSPQELHTARRAMGAAVMDKRIRSADLEGGTFTISNLGTLGIRYFTPVLNPPQVAILGVGAQEGNGDHVRLPLSLTFDHRFNDGAVAARFLQKIQEHLSS